MKERRRKDKNGEREEEAEYLNVEKEQNTEKRGFEKGHQGGTTKKPLQEDDRKKKKDR